MSWLARVGTVSSWTFVSRLLGLWRDRLLAATFGGSLTLSAFLLAFQLPNLLRNLFGEGALSAAFIPRYVQLRERDPAAGDTFAGIVISHLAVWLGILAMLGMVAAGIVLLSVDRDTALVAALAIPQLPYLVFICCSAIMAGTLNGRRHFAVPAAAPVLLNCCLIAAVLIWGDDIWILPYAVLLTGLLQCGLHLLALAGTGGVPKVRLRGDGHIGELGKAFGPTLIASGAHQVNVLFDSLIAFFLVPGSGAVAYLYFGNRLLQFPMALVAHGVNTVIYPELASAAAKEIAAGDDDADDAAGQWRETGKQLRLGSAVLMGLLLPAAVGLAITADPLVRTIYEVGNYGSEDVARTVLVTQFFAISLVPISFVKLYVRAFHAHRNQRTPMRIGLATVAGNLVLNLILVHTSLREAGIALASGLSGIGACLVYIVLLRRRGTGALLAWAAFLLPVGGCIAMAAAVMALLYYWPAAAGSGSLHHGLRLAAAVALGMLVYGLTAGPSALKRWRAARRRDQDADTR